MWYEQVCEALRAGKCFELTYHGFCRVVEVHAVGVTKDGNGIMRVWQVRGGSNSGEQQGWKLLRLDEAFNGKILDEDSAAPRKGYQRGDKHMAAITCEL